MVLEELNICIGENEPWLYLTLYIKIILRQIIEIKVKPRTQGFYKEI